MEPILKNHRKAIVVLELDKKTRFKNESNTVIQAFYEEALQK